MPEKEEKKEKNEEKEKATEKAKVEPTKAEPVKKLHVISNVTETEICIRLGKTHSDFNFYFVPPHGQIEVSSRIARKLYKRIKKTNTHGVGVSGLLKPLGEIKEQPKEEASVEVN